MFRKRFRVFQVMSYQLNYISNDPPIDGGVYFDHMKQFGISFLRQIPCFPDWVIFCEALLRGTSNSHRIMVWPSGASNVEQKVQKEQKEQIIRNSVKNSVFSRLCPISLNTFSKILQLIEGYIYTVLNSLESVLGLFKNPTELSAQDSVFSRLYRYSLNTFQKILLHMKG